MSESSLPPVRVSPIPAIQEKGAERPEEKKQAGSLVLYMRRGSIAGLLTVAAVSCFFLEIVDASVVLTAIATIMLALFTWTLSDATDQMRHRADDTLVHQRQASERELRGYVMYKKSVRLPNGSLAMIWENFGKTPVRDLRAFVHSSFAPLNASGPLLACGHIAARANISLAPSGEYWIELDRRASIERSAAAVLQKEREYIHGRVEYTDAFGKRRYTWFRYWVRGDDTPQNCGEGNDWT